MLKKMRNLLLKLLNLKRILSDNLVMKDQSGALPGLMSNTEILLALEALRTKSQFFNKQIIHGDK